MKHTIAVIGAGLSGLTVAYRLMQRGLDVHVYEARPRVGGRILTAMLNNTAVELGAQNIWDGGIAEHLLNLVSELHLPTISGKINLQFHYHDETNLIDIDNVFKQWENEQRLTTLSGTYQNMEQVLQTLFDGYPVLYKLFAIRLMGYEGLSVDQLSSRYIKTLDDMLHRMHDPYFEYLTLQNGMALLPQALQNKLGDRLSLGMPLRALSKASKNSYTLNFHNGQTIEAERVILTMPCSTYQDICFQDNVIPLSRLQDIQAVSYGKHAKLIVPIEIPENTQGFYANDRFATFSMAPHIVTMYYLNEQSSFTLETIHAVFKRDRSLLMQVYQDPSLSQLQAEYADGKQFAPYQGAVGYSWFGAPYSRGTYSCFAVGQEGLLTEMVDYHGNQVKKLFSPIDDRLFFAGEHTSILTDVTGTMEAAVESGERTARMCLSKSARL